MKDNRSAFQALANEATDVLFEIVLLQSYGAQSSTDDNPWPPQGLETAVEDLIR